MRSLKTTYLAADPRSLGLFRIVFGVLLLGDLLHRWLQLDLWYTNSGLLPNHTLLWRPPATHVFSLFFVASSRAEAAFGFGLCALVYALFLVGYRTRLLHVVAIICRISLNSRLAVLENGGDMVINLLALFTLALPLGRRFSVDAWLYSLRATQPQTPVDWNRDLVPARERLPVYSLAMFGLLAQFTLIYFFNALSKNGEAWLTGSAVHYALHQDKFVTPLGLWMRENLSPSILRYLTWSVLATEWSAVVWIATPLFSNAARLIAFCVLPLLHLGFALGLDLGMFSPAMMSFYPLLLTRAHWDGLGGWLSRHSVAQIVEFDAGDPGLRRIARSVRELDRFGHVTICPLSRPGWRVRGESDRGSRLGPARAVLRALPWGFTIAWLLRVPGIGHAWLELLTRVARLAGREPAAVHSSPRPRALRWLPELAVAVLMAAIATEIVNDNVSVPTWMRWQRTTWTTAVIEYPRLLQGWRMFAPEPPMTDSMIYVDATTASGKHVDPYNSVASRYPFPAAEVVPPQLEQSQFFTMYSDRIGYASYAAYRQAFLEWLLAYPQRTGRASDCLLAFEVYLVTDRSPAPGQGGKPTPVSREKFLDYKAPAHGDCKKTEQDTELHVAQNQP